MFATKNYVAGQLSTIDRSQSGKYEIFWKDSVSEEAVDALCDVAESDASRRTAEATSAFASRRL